MHNSKNSILSKATFTSAVLAQAKLLGISIPSSAITSPDLQAISSAVAEKTEQQVNSNISEVPTFHTPTINLPEVTAEMRATLSRLSATACKKAMVADAAQNILDKADLYEISYVTGIQNTATFSKLTKQVYKWEDLLEAALDLNIDWSESNYDPVALEQEIENAHHEVYLQANTMRSEYCADLV